MATAKIKEVSKNTLGSVPQITFRFDNGQYHNITESYLRKVMDSKLMVEGQSFLHLNGAEVTYELRDIKNGDAVIDDSGNVVEGKTYANLKAPRKKVINFQIDWASCAEGFVQKEMSANAVAKLTLKGAFAGVFKKAATPEVVNELALENVAADAIV